MGFSDKSLKETPLQWIFNDYFPFYSNADTLKSI